MVRKSKIVDLPINQIGVEIYVRTQTNHARVDLLRELYENGTEVEPIVVTENTKRLVDGRHRLAAQTSLGRKTVQCKLVPEMDTVTLIGEAFKANCGGSQPPTSGDIDHTIELFLGQNASIKTICEMLPFPASLVRKHVKNVQSNIAKRQLALAVKAVAQEEMKPSQAANKYGVDLDRLKREIQGDTKDIRVAVGEITGRLSSICRSSTQKIHAQMRAAMEAVEDGDLTPAESLAVAKKLVDLAQRLKTTASDWQKRFEAKAGKPPSKKAVKK